MTKKNIWYISKYASPLKYFLGTRHFNLSEEWVKQGYNVHVFTSNSNHLTEDLPTFKGKIMEEVINGVKTVWLNTFSSKKGKGLKRILSWLHFEWQLLSINKNKYPSPDVIIISSLSLLTILNGIRLKEKYKAKLIFEVRDIWPKSIVELGGYSESNPLIKLLSWVERKGYAKADIVVGTMPNLKEHVHQVIDDTTKRVECIPQGVDFSVYKNSQDLSEEFLNKYIPKDKFIVGYAGSLGKANALETLIYAAEYLKNDDIHFALLGYGMYKNKLIEMAKDLPNITFAPKVKKVEVNSFIQRCDIMYDSVRKNDIYKYGLSRNKWVDYMYAGKPIVVSFSGYLSMLNEANCGVAVPAEEPKILAEEIKKMSQYDKKSLSIMGKRGKKFIEEKRTFKELAKKYELLF